MPRLTTDEQYILIHERLRRLSLNDPYLVSQLSPSAQWLVHRFFAPDRELSTMALLAQRAAITAQEPSLPQRAGRALEHFWSTAAHVGVTRVARAKVPAGPRRKQRDRKLSAQPLVHPEIDAKKLARAFVNLAFVIAEKRAKEREDQERSRP
jgi:hypothetical protein